MPENSETFPTSQPSEAEQRRILGAFVVSAMSLAALLLLIGASDMRAHGVDGTVHHADQSTTD